MPAITGTGARGGIVDALVRVKAEVLALFFIDLQASCLAMILNYVEKAVKLLSRA